MPYSKTHRAKTRARVVEAARVLFNVHGYHGVTIDMVMEAADLTRGGFYNHFANKEALFAAAVDSFLMGRGAKWREDARIDPTNLASDDAANMLKSYLSEEHLGAVQDQCPMIALPSDVARASLEVRESYQKLLEAMVWLFETSQGSQQPEARQKALSMAAMAVGGMVLARTLPDSNLAKDVRQAALNTAKSLSSV